jgi:hypothetical protein
MGYFTVRLVHALIADIFITFIHLVFLTTMPAIFASVYHEKVGIAGLHYIALGIGLSLASQVNARFMDRIYIHFKNKNGGVGEPEFRLREWVSLIPLFHPLMSMDLASMIPGSVILPLGLLLAGWSAEHRLHWIATDIVSLFPINKYEGLNLICFSRRGSLVLVRG